MRPRRRFATRPRAARPLFAAAALLLAGLPAHAQEGLREEVKKAPPPKLTRAPRVVTFVKAAYPKAAIEGRIQGPVVLRVDIDAAGKVTRVEVLSEPGGGLGAAAAAAVQRFRFSPAEVDGKPAPVRIRYTYRFTLRPAFEPELPAWMLPPGARRKEPEKVLVGKVREQGSRLPLPGVAVALPDIGVEVKSDARGRFGFAGVPPGRYRVTAISLEHERQTVEVVVKAGERTRIDFYLKPLTSNRYETVVRGKRRQTTVTRVALKRRELETVPGTFGDPVRVVENLPGVARVPYLGGALLVRGSAPGDSGVFLDGVRIPIIYHFLGGPSVLNSQFLKGIDYYSGNADARYGRLVAGVVDVHTRSTFTRDLHGSLDTNLLWTGAFLNIPATKNISIALAGRRSYVDAILPVVFKASGLNATNVLPVFYDYQARVDVKLGGEDSLSLLVFGSHDRLEVASSEEDRDLGVNLDSRVTFHRVHGQWRARAGKRVVSTLQPSFGIDAVRFGTGQTDIDFTTLAFGLREDVDVDLGPGVRLRTGVDLQLNRTTFTAEVPLPDNSYQPGGAPGGGRGGIAAGGSALSSETTALDLVELFGGIGLYADVVLDIGDRWQVVPGVRFDLLYYTGQVRPTVDPRLTVRYRLFEGTTLKGAVGLFSQNPPINQANTSPIGGKRLLPEQALQSSIGVEQRLFGVLSIDAQLYLNYRFNSVVFNPDPRIERGQIFLRRYSNRGRGFSYGLELLVKHDVTRHFYGWIAYTLSVSRQNIHPDEGLVPFIFDQTHILTVVGSYRIGAGWELGARFRLASGRPETPVLGGIYDADCDCYARIRGGFRSDRRPLFHQLDLRVEKTWLFDLWRLSVYLDVQNVYNAANPEATLYDYRFRESGPLRGLPILPSLGVRGRF